MTPQRLLRLYPRAWQERYGDEMTDLLGTRPLPPLQVIDIVMGAVDAWLSPSVRRITARGSLATNSGVPSMTNLMKLMACSQPKVRYTTRDMLISAGVLLASSALMSFAGIAAKRAGYPEFGEAVLSLAFPMSMLISMPFGLMKGQPWRAQIAVLGSTFWILIFATWIATKI